MRTESVEKTASQLISIGIPLVSLFIVTGSVTDPVNVTKFLLLGAIGMASYFLLLSKLRRELVTEKMIPLIVSGFFVFFCGLSTIMSSSPLLQNIYGVYGRNTGFLTYFFLVGIFLLSLTISDENSFKKLFYGLFATGIVNVIYCTWVLAFGDFIDWNNPYGNLLGLFGNPNFIGAFLGIWISSSIGYFIQVKTNLWKILLLLISFLLGFYAIYETKAVQGVVVSVAGIVTVGFYFIRSKTKGWLLITSYTLTTLSFGVIALLGALQKGPLADLIYKRSVSLRGAYWNAGIDTGLSNPLTGAGMDAYGDWYRRSRSEYAATVLPGPTTVTNSAHNVILDLFSYGGFPLLISYFGILFLGGFAIVRNLRRTRTYDPVFVSLSVAWIGYQLQSVISINQIGLAVWGWVLTGALVAYETKAARQNNSVSGNANKVQSRTVHEQFSSKLVAGIGIVSGLIIAAPPINADMGWMKATKSGNLLDYEKVLSGTYLNPLDSSRLVNMVATLENNQLYDQALEYALRATKFNPENFDSWYALYFIRNSSPEQKELALKNIKRLDPFNPDFISK